MHVLMISLDSQLATRPDSDTVKRHATYAQLAGRLSVVTYTGPRAGGAQTVDSAAPLSSAPGLVVLPTHSRSRLLFIPDAIRAASRLIEQERPDLITTQDPFTTGFVGWWLRRRYGIPLLVQNHSNTFGNPAWLAQSPVRNRAFVGLGQFVVKRADAYRAVGERERRRYLAMGGEAERAFVLPLGTVTPAFTRRPPEDVLADARSQLGLLPEHRVILWVGYPVPLKRVPLLMRAFRQVVAQVPQARLLLVGDMRQSVDDLPALASSYSLADHVLMHGPVSHAELPAYYGLADVYAITSTYEGVPRVLMEASAMGLPLVGMDVVGVQDFIRHGQNGLLVPDGDEDALAAAFIDLLQTPQKRQALGSAARDHALQFYDAGHNAEQVVDMWQRTAALGLRS